MKLQQSRCSFFDTLRNIRDEQQAKPSGKGLDGSLLPERLFCEGFNRGTRLAQPEAERMPAVHHERYSSINFLWKFMFHSKTAQQCHMIDHHLTLKDTRQEGDREADAA